MSKKIKISERCFVYTKALEIMRNEMGQNGYSLGICACIEFAIKLNISNCDFVRRQKHLHIENYPELMEQKPPHNENNEFWFSNDLYGYQTRVKILEIAIEKTKPL